MIPRSTIPAVKSASTGWGNNWKTPPPASGSDWRTNTAPSPYRLRTGAFEPAAPTQLPATGIPLTSKLASMIDKDLRAAIAQADADTATPTDAQRESGNYKKGKFTWNGIGITIETAKGQKRTGVNKATKQPWSVTLKNSYGYIRGTDSAEPGDQMDVFVGPTPESEIVYVVDQNKQDGKTFDEHKCVIGATSAAQAKQLYHDNYNKGWSGFRNITALTVPQFKNWLKSGDMTKPLCGQEFAKFHKQASNAARRLFTRLMRDTMQKRVGWHGTSAPNVASILQHQTLRPGVMTSHGADLTLSQPIPLPAFARQGGLVGIDLARTGTPITPSGFSTKARSSDMGAWASASEMPLTGSGTPHLHAPQQAMDLRGGGLRYVTGVSKTLANNAGAKRLPEGLSSWWSRMTQPTGAPYKGWSGDGTPSITAQDAARGLAKLFPSGRINLKALSAPPTWSPVQVGAQNARSWLMNNWANLKSRVHGLWNKQSSFSDVLQEARRQLPGFHGWETAGGAVAGAGAGTAVQLARRMMQSKREKEQHGAPSLLRGAAVGAGLGAFGGNLVGDRARRYISNMPNPFGYNASARLNDMREAGWEGLLRGAVLDQPIQGGKAQGGEGGSEQNKAMRRELMRRGFGVHTDSPATDWFQNSGADAEGAPVLNLADRLFNPSGTLQASALPAWKEVAPDGSILDWMAEPGRFGKPVQQVSNVFNRFSVTPYGKSMKMYDKWDFDLHPDEQNRAAQVLQKWRTGKLDEPEKREGMSLLARWLASKTIASKMPAFQQTFAIAGEGKKPDWLTEGETADYSNADNWNKDTLPTRLK